MRSLRSQFGLILWACIALIVFCVPQWRLRAGRQWQSSLVGSLLSPSINKPDNPDPKGNFGMSSDEAQVAARRFPNDVAAQLAQFDRSEIVKQYNAIQESLFDQYYSNAAQMARAQKKLHQSMPRLWKLTDEYFARYGALERQFPDSNIVRAQHLRDAMRGAIISDEGPLPPLPAGTTMPLMLRAESWLSATTCEAALRTAREGARLEPDNAFFPWMEAILCFSAGQNDGALRALEAAGRCSKFRDYGLPTVAQRLDVLKRVRATGWEDDYTETTFGIFPHLAKMRSAARTATGQMRLARRRGDRALAFRFAAAATRAGLVVARSGDSTLIGHLVGQTICSLAWRGAVEGEPDAPQSPVTSPSFSNEQRDKLYADYREQNALLFAKIARANNQDDLAREVVVANSHFDGTELGQWVISSPNALIPRIEELVMTYWLGSQLLRLSLGGAVLWVLCWGLTRRKADSFGRARSQMLIPTMFFIGVTGTLLFVARAFIPFLYQFSSWISNSAPSPEPSPGLADAYDQGALLAGVLWLLIVLVATCLRNIRNRKDATASRKVDPRRVARGVVWPLFIVCVLITLAALSGRAPTSEGTDVIVYGAGIVVGLVWLAASTLLVCRTAGKQRTFAITIVSSVWLGVLGELFIGAYGIAHFLAIVSLGLSVLLAIAALILAIRIWPFKKPNLALFAVEATLRARVVAGTLALFCAFGYLGLALWAIPKEQSVRALLNRQSQIGEIALLREQIQKESTPH